MAIFDNVTYTYYSNDLGRSVIPNEETFNKYALENKLWVKGLFFDGLIIEKELNGIDSAVCMMCEVDYKSELIANGEDNADYNSENLGAYSYSKNTKAYETFIEKNTKSVQEQKFKYLRLYCVYSPGVK